MLQRVLIPFSGGEVHDETNLTYNFYLSQLRICIEMTFGLLTQKWAVVAHTMKYSNKTNLKLIVACIKLHNFCIRMKQKDSNDNNDDKNGSQQITKPSRGVVLSGLVGSCTLAAMGVDPNYIDDDGNIISPRSGHFSTAIATEHVEEDMRIHNSVMASSFSTLVSDSTQRQFIVQNLASRGLERPAANKIRNKQQQRK